MRHQLLQLVLLFFSASSFCCFLLGRIGCSSLNLNYFEILCMAERALLMISSNSTSGGLMFLEIMSA